MLVISRCLRQVAALLLVTMVGSAATAQLAAAADLSLIGQRIYREGILPNGQPLRGVSQAGAVLSGAQAACTTCHRRSGYGSSEGPVEVRSITGPALFGDRVAPIAPGSPVARQPSGTLPAAASPPQQSAAQTARSNAEALRAIRTARFAGARQRPVYTDVTLGRAIVGGIDVTERVMDASMPRFTLDATALAALTAYLKTLSVATSPGVTDTTLHFATVIQPGTDQAQRRALVEVLQAFIRDRNLGQRVERNREHSGQVSLGRVYRDWTLHVWELTGASDTWGAQLDRLYRQQPVYAMIGGLGSASWRPIHDFSERMELPCIFPQADVPVIDRPSHYTVYLSEGVSLEARALARYLQDSGVQGPVLQIYGRDDASTTAAAALRAALTGRAGGLLERQLPAAPPASFWRDALQAAPGTTLVLWLRPDELEHAAAFTVGVPFEAIYLSSALTAGHTTALDRANAGRLRIVYPQDPPALRNKRLEVVRRWLQNNNIDLTNEQVQFNAYLAATVVGMEVAAGQDTYSRDFLLERMEHRLGTALELSMYPRLSLGPGQRFASKGSYIAQVTDQQTGQLSLISDWIVP
jgi:hypothetical protein